MLESLSIRNIVLIEDLHISFRCGLCLLTGETGAGKSILLDALGLALGERADSRLLRAGASKAQVTATFSLPSTHLIWKELDKQGIDYGGGELIFRRILEADGKNKCFLNDQIISQNLMRRLGQELVEIHGQFDTLFQPKSHLNALDEFGKLNKSPIAEAYKHYLSAKENLQSFQEDLAKSHERQAYLRFAIEDVKKINPKQGEEKELENERALIAHHAKMAETFVVTSQNLTSAISDLSQTHKALTRIQDLIPQKISPLLEIAERALIETQELFEEIGRFNEDVEGSPHSLETLENRLYTLRDLARKYQTEDLLTSLETFKEELSSLNHGEESLKALEQKLQEAHQGYLKKAQQLSKARQDKALELEKAIMDELAPLKLGQASFHVHFDRLKEEHWGPHGYDRVEFYVQTNPGTPEGPLSSIASGGELSRFMLALKVVLVQSWAVPTLIFDEIESGIGGAVAAAMGERLKALSNSLQVLAITHSPQIAAHGTQHLIVFKEIKNGVTTAHMKELTTEDRDEEVARMLAGQEITDEARAAARRLMGAGR
ncbi:MAG: hypothetical protein ACD_16C00224G0008 [uncultured bacterium]|nr:MAG: hypothetical protein ACD_16C00224G0008 [uncultured bacterium]OFW69342.1 MAG: DNA repair protein RecN [Alphaproteobacteria bacterium GWC2_42_16]OFW74053.1 MAG: DNA repair protein RecN [Alphaproteobacteria bacterium GWA2_41_27]OFW83099.1 MAG: DNA repair protein RecN [Alphaproteobacteria bacterium RIFCSPHIGHO2_12_FULL_42_100]OFW84593.1 MAG: DNA repair protein RecN [Alphaproteobacteria bacterium RBG_16_42_14]OFW92016.1 MAG: DNA repair protein RecN [Alphaproteobacteria bacterium RIFCSPHIGHO